VRETLERIKSYLEIITTFLSSNLDKKLYINQEFLNSLKKIAQVLKLKFNYLLSKVESTLFQPKIEVCELQ